MRIDYLGVRNFLSIVEAELTFPAGVHMVNGVNFDLAVDGNESNGAGKSALMDALLWVIFEEINRGKIKEDDVINREEGKNCRVEVRFEHGGSLYRILRCRKDDEEGNCVRWWIDGKEQTLAGKTDTQADLEKRLPVSVEVFKHAVQIGQGMPDRFLDLSETAKQELLCQIVNLGCYDEALEKAKGKVAASFTAVTLADSSLKGLAEQIAKWESDLTTCKQSLQAFKDAQASNMAATQAKLAAIKEEITTCKAKADEVAPLVLASQETITQLLNKIRDMQEVSSGVYRKVSDADAALKHTLAQMRNLEATPDVCPTCKRPMDNSHLVGHLMELAEKADGEKAILAEMQKEYALEVAKVRVVEQELNTTRGKAHELGKVRDSSMSKVVSLQASLPKLEAAEREYEKQVAQFEGRVKTTEETIATMRASLVPTQERLAAAKKDQAHWEFWKTTIPNLRAAAMEEVLSYLNTRLVHYMEVFSSGSIGVRLFQEAYGKGSKIKVELRTPAGTYGLSSGGEKRRIDLAIYLSLSDLLQASAGLHCNLLVADEIADGLSPLGVGKLLEVLKDKANSGVSVLVMSHNPAIQQGFEFTSIWTVEKRQGRARLVGTQTAV